MDEKNAPRCTTVGLHSASSEKHENCTARNIKRENNRTCEDPLVQTCMCPTYTNCSRMHAEKHYLFLPYRDLERNPNNIRIVVNYTFKITLKVSGLKAPDEIIHGLSCLIEFRCKISVLECLICQWTMSVLCPFLFLVQKEK